MKIPPSRRGATTPRLCALSDLKAKLKTEMCKSLQTGECQNRQGITTNGRTFDLWSINKPQMVSGTIVILNSTKSIMFWGTALVQFFIKNTPTGTASLPMQTAPSALALIVRFTFFFFLVGVVTVSKGLTEWRKKPIRLGKGKLLPKQKNPPWKNHTLRLPTH